MRKKVLKILYIFRFINLIMDNEEQYFFVIVSTLKSDRNEQLLLVSSGGSGRLVEGANQNGESRGVSEGVRRSYRRGGGEGPLFPGVRRLEPAGRDFQLVFPRRYRAEPRSVRSKLRLNGVFDQYLTG